MQRTRERHIEYIELINDSSDHQGRSNRYDKYDMSLTTFVPSLYHTIRMPAHLSVFAWPLINKCRLLHGSLNYT